jgi:hypothetical protein
MRLRRTELFGATAIAGGTLILFACSGGEDYPPFPTSTGGTAPTNSGGAATTGGVAATGGTLSSGGFSTGGTTGGFSTGGTTGGSSTGGTTGGSIFGNTGGMGGKGGFGTTGGKSGAGGKSGTGGSGGKSGTGGSGGKSGIGGTSGKGGSAGSGGSSGSGSVAFSQVASYVRSKCGTCHMGSRMPTLNTADNAALYTTLTTATVARCANNKLATAGDPSKSALIMVSTGQCGTLRMPNGCTSNAQCISTSDQTMLTNWIQSGAKNP